MKIEDIKQIIPLAIFAAFLCVFFILAPAPEATQITVQSLEGPYPGTVAANDLDITWASASITTGATYSITGREIILVHNASSNETHYATFVTVADNLGRKGDIENYAIGADEYIALSISNTLGWANSSGVAYATPENTTLEFSIIRY